MYVTNDRVFDLTGKWFRHRDDDSFISIGHLEKFNSPNGALTFKVLGRSH